MSIVDGSVLYNQNLLRVELKCSHQSEEEEEEKEEGGEKGRKRKKRE